MNLTHPLLYQITSPSDVHTHTLLPNVLPTINPREDEKHRQLAPPKHGKSAVVALLKVHDFKSARTMGSVSCVLPGFVLLKKVTTTSQIVYWAFHNKYTVHCIYTT